MSICSFGYLRMKNFFDIKRTLYGKRKKIYLKKSFFQLFLRVSYKDSTHGLRTPNEDINQRYLKNWADVADKICCRHT